MSIQLLTGCRASEIAFEDCALHLAKDRSKNKRGNLITFSNWAWQIIVSLPRNNHSEYLFSNDQGKKLIDKGLPKKFHDCSNHDLRHTFRTKRADFEVPTKIAELAISHKPAGMEARYNHKDFVKETYEAAELYSQFIGGIDE